MPRRTPRHRATGTKWQKRSSSLQEITELTERLGTSRNKADRALGDAISADVLPGLLDTGNARRRAAERAAALEAAPRKRSSRLQVSVVLLFRLVLLVSPMFFATRD